MSGTARPLDSGRRDALGRTIKVAAGSSASRADAPPPPGTNLGGVLRPSDDAWTPGSAGSVLPADAEPATIEDMTTDGSRDTESINWVDRRFEHPDVDGFIDVRLHSVRHNWHDDGEYKEYPPHWTVSHNTSMSSSDPDPQIIADHFPELADVYALSRAWVREDGTPGSHAAVTLTNQLRNLDGKWPAKAADTLRHGFGCDDATIERLRTMPLEQVPDEIGRIVDASRDGFAAKSQAAYDRYRP